MGLFKLYSEEGTRLYRLLTDDADLWELNFVGDRYENGIRHPSGLVLDYNDYSESLYIDGSSTKVLGWWETMTITQLVSSLKKKLWLDRERKKVQASLNKTTQHTPIDPTAKELAKAVLRGDMVAARALHDRLTELWSEGN